MLPFLFGQFRPSLDKSKKKKIKKMNRPLLDLSAFPQVKIYVLDKDKYMMMKNDVSKLKVLVQGGAARCGLSFVDSDLVVSTIAA